MISRTRIRSFIAGVVASVILLVFAAFATSAMEMDIPILRNISAMLGFGS